MKMNKTNVAILLVFALFLTLFFPILFACLHIWDFVSAGTMAIYIITKVIVTLYLIWISIQIAQGKLNMYFSYLNLILVLIFQTLPLAVRVIGCLDYIAAMVNYSWIIELFVAVVWIFTFVLLDNAYKNQGERYSKTLKKVQATKHRPVSNKTYFDDNGDLKGPGSN